MKQLLWGTLLVALPALATADPLYMEDFESNPTAGWTVNDPGLSDVHADFFFDYSTVGIPLAPSSAPGGSRGLQLQANLFGNVFSGFSVSPTGHSFTGDYTLQFDWWANLPGPFPEGSNGTTNLSTFGIGTSGTIPQWQGGTQDSVWFGATGDGGSSTDWRAYSPDAPTHYLAPHPVYPAPSTNNSDPYYGGFGGVAAPAAQLALYPDQTGLTAVGSAGMAWHQVEIARSGNVITWIVDGLLLASVDVATFAPGLELGGSNIFFGHADVNALSSSDPLAPALLFTLIDNVRVLEAGDNGDPGGPSVPEPSVLLLLGAGLAAVGRRFVPRALGASTRAAR